MQEVEWNWAVVPVPGPEISQIPPRRLGGGTVSGMGLGDLVANYTNSRRLVCTYIMNSRGSSEKFHFKRNLTLSGDFKVVDTKQVHFALTVFVLTRLYIVLTPTD